MIDENMIYSALIVITLFMVIVSVPSIFLLSRSSFKQMKRYTFLRAFKEVDDSVLPSSIINDLNSVRSDVGYATLITEELEKMSSLRTPIFQTEIAIVLIIIMAFVPGYETNVLILMMTLLAVCIIGVIYGSLALRAISREYIRLLHEMDEKGEKSNGNMYG